MSRLRFFLFLTVSLIFVIGLVMIFSTSSAEVLDHNLDKSTKIALIRQGVYALFGIALAFCVSKFGYRQFLLFSPILLFFFTLLLILVLIPGIGKEVNGSRRWLAFGPFSFQPSEFVKLIVPAYFIHSYFSSKVVCFWDFLKLTLPCALPIALILIEPNTGTAGVVALTLVLLFFLTGISWKYWAAPLLVCVILGGAFASQLPYVSARLKVYLYPELDLHGRGHQPYQAKIAAGSGGLFGKGPGNSWQKLSYLPEAQNDYIAAIYAEEFGFVGILFLICLYLIVLYCGISLAFQSADFKACALASCLTFLICFQAFLNLGVVSALLPSTGLNLPFFSQGGSSLLVNLVGVGLLFSVEGKKAAMTNPSIKNSQ